MLYIFYVLCLSGAPLNELCPSYAFFMCYASSMRCASLICYASLLPLLCVVAGDPLSPSVLSTIWGVVPVLIYIR